MVPPACSARMLCSLDSFRGATMYTRYKNFVVLIVTKNQAQVAVLFFCAPLLAVSCFSKYVPTCLTIHRCLALGRIFGLAQWGQMYKACLGICSMKCATLEADI